MVAEHRLDAISYQFVAFGEDGKAARAAVGMASLPSNIAVEIEAIVELHDD